VKHSMGNAGVRGLGMGMDKTRGKEQVKSNETARRSEVAGSKAASAPGQRTPSPCGARPWWGTRPRGLPGSEGPGSRALSRQLGRGPGGGRRLPKARGGGLRARWLPPFPAHSSAVSQGGEAGRAVPLPPGAGSSPAGLTPPEPAGSFPPAICMRRR